MAARKVLESDAGIKIEEIEYSFAEHLEKKTKGLPENYTVLLLVNANDYNEVLLGIIEKFVVNDKARGIFLTANKQTPLLLQAFQKKFKEFDSKKIFFLDCASKDLKLDNAIVCNPQNLIDLNIAMNQALEVLPSGGFFVMDSISTLSIYNDEKVLKKFVKIIVEKCYSKKVNGVFLCNNSKNTKELVEGISPFFDETMDAERM